jgi:isoleucyl-tRNA synthetase
VEEKNASSTDDVVSASLPTGGFVLLDKALDADLEAEGYARDVIRATQDARKDAGLQITDRIVLTVHVPSAADAAKVEQFKDLVAGDTLADSVTVVADGANEIAVDVTKA